MDEARPVTAEIDSLRRQLDLRTRQLERSVARFYDVIERNPDAQVVVDSSGRIRFANRSATQLFGRRREELVDSDFGFPLVAGETTEVDLLARGDARVAEMRVVRSEWEGETAYIASLRDVTERKRAEQDARRLIREQAARVAAEESAHRLRFVLESSTVLSSSLDYEATLSSLARLCVPRIADWTVVYGLGEDGQPLRLDIAHHDSAKTPIARELKAIPIDPRGAHPVLDVLRTRRARVAHEVTPEELAAMAATPRELELARALGVGSFMLVPMIARDRLLGAIAFIASDVDRRFDEGDLALAEDIGVRAALAVDNALLYREAHRANQTKADFLAVVSHDLRTPLTAIMGYAELMEMGVPEPLPDRSLERVQRIRVSAKHLLYLMNELLAFARLDAGRETVTVGEVDVRDVLREVTDVVEPLAREKQLSLHCDVPDAPVALSTDPDKLRQILVNLTHNAVKYTKQGRVQLTLQDADPGVTIAVTDTGDGIADEHIGQIFEPFWQVDPAQRTRGGGTGLGLSVVQRLCALLGGNVQVESRIGAGSTFTVSLPRSLESRA